MAEPECTCTITEEEVGFDPACHYHGDKGMMVSHVPRSMWDPTYKPPAEEWHGKFQMTYEVVCTYTVEADSKAAAGRVAGSVAQSLSKTGVIRSSSADGLATLTKTRARYVRHT